MEGEGQLELYEIVAAQLKEAHRRLRSIETSESERASLQRQLLAATATAKHDLASAARRLERLMAELDGHS